MPACFFDTCALVPRYRAGKFTHRVNGLFAGPRDIFVAEITMVEIVSAFGSICRNQKLSSPVFEQMNGAFLDDVATGRIQVRPISRSDMLRARHLLSLAGMSNRRNLGSSDALVAVSCRELALEIREAGHSEALAAYLTAMSQFHNYSFQNILLIASQRPTATRVAGIRSWNELGRRVKRGERGIMIFAPMIGYRRNSSDVDQSQQSDARTDKPEPRLVGFRAVYVFDVGQTEGAELPELGSTFKGEVGDKLGKLADFTSTQGIKLEYSDKIAPARGMSYGGLIRILPDMEPSETLATFVHELAHEMLHRAERRTLTTKTVRETEAEAVAFVVCHALGLETGTGSADYIQLYHGDANLLKESLEVVQRTSSVILGAISPKDAVSTPAMTEVLQ